MSIEIEQGKMLIIKLLAIGTLDTKKGTRECFFEMNGEVRAVIIEDRDAAIENVTREKATSDPGSVGSPMVSVAQSLIRVMLMTLSSTGWCCDRGPCDRRCSGQGRRPAVCLVCHEGTSNEQDKLLLCKDSSSITPLQMESVVSSPVSGKVKRVLVKQTDSIAQGDLVVEIGH
jgi:pyruvate carboxylase